MDNNLQEAKEMFSKYGGIHFFMAREGEYEKYKSFNISKEQELMWIKEIQQKKIFEIKNELLDAEKIEIRFSGLLLSLKVYKSIELFPILFELYKDSKVKLDSFSKMLIAEQLLDAVRSLSKEMKNNELIEEVRIFAVDILKDILDNIILVDPAYCKVQHLKDVVKEDAMKERIQRSLKEWDI